MLAYCEHILAKDGAACYIGEIMQSRRVTLGKGLRPSVEPRISHALSGQNISSKNWKFDGVPQGPRVSAVQGDFDDFGLRKIEDSSGRIQFEIGDIKDSFIPVKPSVSPTKGMQRAPSTTKEDESDEAGMVCLVCASTSSPGIGANALHWDNANVIEHGIWKSPGIMSACHGYLHLNLRAVLDWSKETQERVMIEAGFKLDDRCLLALTSYMLERLDWHGFEKLCYRLPIKFRHVDERGRFVLAPHVLEESCGRWTFQRLGDAAVPPLSLEEEDALLCSIVARIENCYEDLPAYFQRFISTCLARKGLLLSVDTNDESFSSEVATLGKAQAATAKPSNSLCLSADDDNIADSDPKMHPPMVNTFLMLCEARAFFLPKDSFEQDAGLLRLLPFSSLSWFHIRVIEMFATQGNISLLEIYLDHYELATSRSTLTLLDRECGFTFNHNQELSTMLLKRVGCDQSVFEASLHDSDRVFQTREIPGLLNQAADRDTYH